MQNEVDARSSLLNKPWKANRLWHICVCVRFLLCAWNLSRKPSEFVFTHLICAEKKMSAIKEADMGARTNNKFKVLLRSGQARWSDKFANLLTSWRNFVERDVINQNRCNYDPSLNDKIAFVEFRFACIIPKGSSLWNFNSTPHSTLRTLLDCTINKWGALIGFCGMRLMFVSAVT